MSTRNYTFDAARGAAAIAVLLYHVGHVTGSQIAPSGYLAVDFFFMLSGFVIERAYAARLAAGMSLGGFVSVRLRRLYPLFALGLLLGIGRAIGAMAMHDPRAPSAAGLVGQIITGALMLPYRGGAPLNTPAWSLYLELWINFVFALGLYRAGTRTLLALCAIGAAGLCAGLMVYGNLDQGWNASSYWVGVSRVLFGFCGGILMARCPLRIPMAGAWTVPLALVSVMMFLPHDRPFFDGAAVFVIMPVLLFAMAQAPSMPRRLSEDLGDLSYPLYAIHFPLLMPLWLVCRHLGLAGLPATCLITVACLLAASAAVAADAGLKSMLSSYRKPVRA